MTENHSQSQKSVFMHKLSPTTKSISNDKCLKKKKIGSINSKKNAKHFFFTF